MGYQSKQVSIGDVEITVTYKPCRTLRLVVERTGRLRASVPLRTSNRTLQEFLRPRVGWMKAHQQRVLSAQLPPKQFVQNEIHSLWGNEYQLDVSQHGRPQVRLETERIVLVTPVGAGIELRRSVLERWYRQEFADGIEHFRQKWQPTVSRQATTWSIRWMKTRWGSCNVRSGRITLNLELVKRDPLALESTMVHELCHLLVPGHGQTFWTEVESRFPDYRKIRKLLHSEPIQGSFWG